MIRKLRLRFIAASMLAVTLVLVFIFSAINVSNHYLITNEADTLLNAIAHYGGEFPDVHTGAKITLDEGEGVVVFSSSSRNELSKESLYSARYFSVILDGSGKAVAANTNQIATVNAGSAAEYALTAFRHGKERGYLGNFRYLITQTSAGTMIIFLDRASELTSAANLISTSAAVVIFATLLILILTWLFSKRIFRPTEESYQKQRQFITNAGHELKTPLAIINSCTEVIEMESGESKWTEGIHDQTKRLADMTKELINLARMDEEETDLEKTAFDLSGAVKDTLKPFPLMAEEHGFKMDLQIEDGITFYGNEKALRQVASILGDNAVKYAKPGSTIEMKLHRRGRRIHITSFNQTEGITKGEHPELFERFYRGDQSRSSQKFGYGIGLSMARSIAESHGGCAYAESADGQSLKIVISMPDRFLKRAGAERLSDC